MNDRIFIRNLNLDAAAALGTVGHLRLDLDCGLDRLTAGEALLPEPPMLRSIALNALARGPFSRLDALAEHLAETILASNAAVADVTVRLTHESATEAGSHGVEISRPRRRRIGFSLGSNMGNKVANIQTALSLLRTESVADLDAVSSLYRTAPWGNEDQDWFVNACATGWTTLSPLDVLKACKRIEFKVGRVPTVRWGPRAIDVDILFIDDIRIRTPDLTLPHPEMFNRAFVLAPLAEIAGDRSVAGRDVRAELERLGPDADTVCPLET